MTQPYSPRLFLCRFIANLAAGFEKAVRVFGLIRREFAACFQKIRAQFSDNLNQLLQMAGNRSVLARFRS
jgi:hypothetical protein